MLFCAEFCTCAGYQKVMGISVPSSEYMYIVCTSPSSQCWGPRWRLYTCTCTCTCMYYMLIGTWSPFTSSCATKLTSLMLSIAGECLLVNCMNMNLVITLIACRTMVIVGLSMLICDRTKLGDFLRLICILFDWQCWLCLSRHCRARYNIS